MLPPPARSKQMNGILPAPVVILQAVSNAWMSRGQRRARRSRRSQHAGQRRRDHRGGAGDEALREELAARARPGVILVTERLVANPRL